MSKPKLDISAGMKARQAVTESREAAPANRNGGSGSRAARESEHYIGVKIPVSLDDRIEEKVLEIKKAARLEGVAVPTINKRLLIKLGLLELVELPVATILQRLAQEG
jgi:hypothetical protein